MPEPAPASRVTRRTLLGASFAVLGTSLAACSLRLEDDAPLPGPKASPAPDAGPLKAVRARLLTACEAAQHESTDAAAKTAAGLHDTQLTRLDATLEGLGATPLPPVPTATSTAAPSPSSTGASPSAGGPTSPATASASTTRPTGATSPSPTSSAPTAWTRAEASWTSSAALGDLTRVSQASRPLAMSIAARSLATLPSTTPAPEWPDALALHPSTAKAVSSPLAAAVAAQEWVAAKTPLLQREPLVPRLHWLYAATSLVDAADSTPASASPEPLRRFTDVAAANRFTQTALLNIISACAGAAATQLDVNQAAGLLYVWSNAVATAQSMGSTQGPFPGLAAN